mmetsp:Transcript_25775/g.76312  ORF Transcript_25775/g.76312 Transcript_25775/m.76312 type:complete len:111 (+) Transcript_25775:2324-2656(+)
MASSGRGHKCPRSRGRLPPSLARLLKARMHRERLAANFHIASPWSQPEAAAKHAWSNASPPPAPPLSMLRGPAVRSGARRKTIKATCGRCVQRRWLAAPIRILCFFPFPT